MPKEAWKVTKADVRRLKPEDMKSVHDVDQNSEASYVKVAQPYDPYQNRHKFQKEVIYWLHSVLLAFTAVLTARPALGRLDRLFLIGPRGERVPTGEC